MNLRICVVSCYMEGIAISDSLGHSNLHTVTCTGQYAQRRNNTMKREIEEKLNARTLDSRGTAARQ